MSKVYIVSTHLFDAVTAGGQWAASFLPAFRKNVLDATWNSYFGDLGSILDNYHYYYELPGDDDCRVYAVHELPGGNDCLSRQWIEMLSRFFVKDQDEDICFILHDKDLSGTGRPYFYSFAHSKEENGQRFRVYGFQHDPCDIIWRYLSRQYSNSFLFSESIEPVLEVIRAKEILEDCISNHKYPDKECFLLSNHLSVDSLSVQFPNPNSLDYLNHLLKIKKRILKMV